MWTEYKFISSNPLSSLEVEHEFRTTAIYLIENEQTLTFAAVNTSLVFYSVRLYSAVHRGGVMGVETHRGVEQDRDKASSYVSPLVIYESWRVLL